jgi:hypothetical protein
MRAAAGLLCLVLIATDGSAASCQKNFEPVEQTPGAIYAAAAPAVLAITCGSELGTAYIIDAEQGFVLTALHVVKLRGAHAIKATAHGRKDEFELKFVDAIPEKDIALLQIDPLPDDLRKVRALDLVDITPRNGRDVYTLGYPQLKTADGKIDPKRDQIPLDAQFERAEPDGTFRISGLKRPADSGSPLFDHYGRVLGTCVSAFIPPAHAEEAFYAPSSDALRLLLDRVPMSPRMLAVDAQIRNGVDLDTLAVLLSRADGACCTNVELLLWSRRVASARDETEKQYRAHADLLDCPLTVACDHRQVWEASYNLRGYLKPVVAGRAALRAAQEFVRRNAAPTQVAAAFQEARTYLGQALADRAAAEPGGFERVACKAGREAIMTIRSADPVLAAVFPDTQASNTPCAGAVGDTPTYYLLHDYTLATLGADTASATPNRTALAAAAATIFAATNTNQKALGYATAGDAFTLIGEHGTAFEAYANAYKAGIREEWVSDKWSVSVRAALPFDSASRLLARRIESSPTLTIGELKTKLSF